MRRVRAVVLDTATGQAQRVRVSLTDHKVEQVDILNAAVDGNHQSCCSRVHAVDEIVKADAAGARRWPRRGITDLDLVRPCPLSAGDFDLPGEKGRRLLRVLSFLRATARKTTAGRTRSTAWSPTSTSSAQRVVELIDHATCRSRPRRATSTTRVRRAAAHHAEADRDHPARGPSFTVDGDVVTLGGLAVPGRVRRPRGPRPAPDLAATATGERPSSTAPRSPRWSCPTPTRARCGSGRTTSTPASTCWGTGQLAAPRLRLPRRDPLLRRGARRRRGPARETIPNAICMHEEDVGVLWKHTDLFTESQRPRRQRRLVISFFVTVGNYDYGFYWYLYLDGTIELEVKATGVVFTSAYVEDSPCATEVAPGLGAPYHQHLFCARLDMMVDGRPTPSTSSTSVRCRSARQNPYGNAFTRESRRLHREAEAAATGRHPGPGLADRQPRAGRTGSASPSATCCTRRASRRCSPTTSPPSPAAPRSRPSTCGSRGTTRAERYPAGDLVNQHPGGAGCPRGPRRTRPIDGADSCSGTRSALTHFPRPEDWPVMPVDTCGFTLRPVGSSTATRLSTCLARPLCNGHDDATGADPLRCSQRCIVIEIDATVSSIPAISSCNCDGMALSKELIIMCNASDSCLVRTWFYADRREQCSEDSLVEIHLLAVVNYVVQHEPRTCNVVEIHCGIAIARMTEEFPSTLSANVPLSTSRSAIMRYASGASSRPRFERGGRSSADPRY